MISAQERGAQVEIEVAGPSAGRQRVAAEYLVGCDGASSPLRRQLGIELESFDYDEPWIVVDLQVQPATLARLPQTNVQYCEPERPCTYIVCPGNHRRWEFMLLDGEPSEGALTDERLWRLLSRWLAPGEAHIWRAAAYRFHALIAREWRRGRMFLAGDSAHQTPPFLGQGMCQGLRDAANLAWKLDFELRGRAPPGLLDTYAEERRPHVAATTKLAKELGRLVSERDPARARDRDARLLANGGGTAPTVIRQDMIPGLAGGLLAEGAAAAGQVFPQPIVRNEVGAEFLFDELCEPCFRLVLFEGSDAPVLRARAAERGLRVIVLGEPADSAFADDAAIRVAERDGLLRSWFAAARCRGAVVRPDHYVYGAFADDAQGLRLIESMPPLQ
jgi:3-(3-hydroxy-phenyl)propionate hydroxylase